MLQLVDLILLSDTTGLLTGEENVSVQGVNVAIQRETQRQRQLEFLQHTGNPIDMGIIGIKGRGAVLRSVSQTIGLDGDAIVPSDDELDKQQQAQQQGQEQQALGQKVEQGIQTGIALGTQKVVSELTSAGLMVAGVGQQPGMGAPPPGGQPGMGPPPPAGGMAQAAKLAQGNQPSPGNNSPAGNLGNIAGNQPAPRPPVPQGGPG